MKSNILLLALALYACDSSEPRRISIERAKYLFPYHDAAFDDGCAYVLEVKWGGPRLSYNSVSTVGKATWYLVSDPEGSIISYDGQHWECEDRD